MKDWFNAALRADVVTRSFKVASVVGTILVLINYWDKLLPYSLDFNTWVKIAMTYCVPYCVSTYASVCAIRPSLVQTEK
ncbi:MAG: nitrate/nitrite transporter NrtS [Gammaproteobacteria bacterium]